MSGGLEVQIGFNEATTMKRSDLVTDVRLANQYGFDGIELRVDKLRDFLSTRTLADLAALFAEIPLKPWTFNAIESATFRGSEGHREILRETQTLCAMGRDLDCRTLIVVPSFDVGEATIQTIEEETATVLNEMGSIASDYGMGLAFEFIGYPNCSVNTFAQAYRIVDRVNRANVGLTVDCFHFHAMNSHVDDLGQASPDRIFMVHLDDCDPFPPGFLRDQHRCFPGQGVIDLRGILTTLERIGYQGPVSVETFRPEYWAWPAEKTIAAAKTAAVKTVADCFPGGIMDA